MKEMLESGAGSSPSEGTESGQESQVSAPAGSPRDEQTSTPIDLSQVDVDARIEGRIAAEVERRFQSAKDKRWAQLERQYGALSEFQQTLAEALDRRNAGASGRNTLAQKASRVLDASGLVNDPAVTDLLEEAGYDDDDGFLDLLADVTELALQRAERSPASAATVTQPGGGHAPQPDLQTEYELRKQRLRLGDVNALMELKREFRQKGLEIF
jgi:hypothetical protein